MIDFKKSFSNIKNVVKTYFCSCYDHILNLCVSWLLDYPVLFFKDTSSSDLISKIKKNNHRYSLFFNHAPGSSRVPIEDKESTLKKIIEKLYKNWFENKKNNKQFPDCLL